MARPTSSLLGDLGPPTLTSSTIVVGDTIVVQLWGEHDGSTVGLLAAVLASAVALDEANVVVDLSKVQFINSATVRVLTAAGDFLRGEERTFSLRSPSRCAQRVLELCDAIGLVETAPAIAPETTRWAATALRTHVTAPAKRVTKQALSTLRDGDGTRNARLTWPTVPEGT
jgi:anti-anti-sigma factor